MQHFYSDELTNFIVRPHVYDVSMHVCVCICMYVCMCVYICLHVYTYVSMYIHMYVGLAHMIFI